MSNDSGQNPKRVAEIDIEAFSRKVHALQCRAIRQRTPDMFSGLVDIERECIQDASLEDPARVIDRAVAFIESQAMELEELEADDATTIDEYDLPGDIEWGAPYYMFRPDVRDAHGFSLMHHLARSAHSTADLGFLEAFFCKLMGYEDSGQFKEGGPFDCGTLEQLFWCRDNIAQRSALAETFTHGLRTSRFKVPQRVSEDNWYDTTWAKSGPDTPDVDGFTLFERVCGDWQLALATDALGSNEFDPAMHSVARIAALWADGAGQKNNKDISPALPILKAMISGGLDLGARHNGLDMAGQFLTRLSDLCVAPQEPEAALEKRLLTRLQVGKLIVMLDWVAHSVPQGAASLQKRPVADDLAKILSVVGSVSKLSFGNKEDFESAVLRLADITLAARVDSDELAHPTMAAPGPSL